MVHTLISKPKIHSYKESFTVNTVSSDKLLQIKRWHRICFGAYICISPTIVSVVVIHTFIQFFFSFIFANHLKLNPDLELHAQSQS